MCANSPRDYTHAGQKRAVAQQVHNVLPLVQDDRSRWYRRVENNGWRLLTGKVERSIENMLLVTYDQKLVMFLKGLSWRTSCFAHFNDCLISNMPVSTNLLMNTVTELN